MDNSLCGVYTGLKIEGFHKGYVMFKLITRVLAVVLLFAAAPFSQAQAYTLQEQRDDVYTALSTVIVELQADIAEAQADLATRPPTSRAAQLLRRKIMILNGRVRRVQSLQRTVYYFNSVVLDRLIVRFDLPVSLS